LSSSASFQQSLRRLKPEKYPKGLLYRDRSQLRFLSDLKPPFPKLLLDTTVYIDALQGRLPDYAEVALRAGSLWHSTVAEAELSVLAGLLDPKRPQTTDVIVQLGCVHRLATCASHSYSGSGYMARSRQARRTSGTAAGVRQK
jgi:hypothetical protein